VRFGVKLVALTLLLIWGSACKQRTPSSGLTTSGNIGELKTFSRFNMDLLLVVYSTHHARLEGSVLNRLNPQEAAAAESMMARWALQNDRMQTVNTGISGVKLLTISRIADSIATQVLQPCLPQNAPQTRTECSYLARHWGMILGSLQTKESVLANPTGYHDLWKMAFGDNASHHLERDQWMQWVSELQHPSDIKVQMILQSIVLHPRFLILN
jgi:hypothetical protein